METETDTQPAPVVEEVQELPKEADEGVAEIIHEEGRRVKVYELRDQSWHDRGTGHCRGRYDGDRDRAVLLVEAESEDKEEGGFVKEALLLDATVEKEDIYARQQGEYPLDVADVDTLIVWTDPSGLDIALSFQDAEGCEDIWQFIMEVQRHLNNQPSRFARGVADRRCRPSSVQLAVIGFTDARVDHGTNTLDPAYLAEYTVCLL